MSILRIKDKDGNWQEVPYLQGPPGPAYELTAEDRAQLVQDVLLSLPRAEGKRT